MSVRYGFRENGDFVACCDHKRIGVFAFASSINADRALRGAENAKAVANTMIAEFWTSSPAQLREEHYKLSCDVLGGYSEPPRKPATRDELLALLRDVADTLESEFDDHSDPYNGLDGVNPSGPLGDLSNRIADAIGAAD